MSKTDEELKKEEKLREMALAGELSKLANGKDWDYKIRKYNKRKS